MKITMQMTLDGLLRALRSKAHRMADEIEAGYARHAVVVAGAKAERDRTGADDDVSGA